MCHRRHVRGSSIISSCHSSLHFCFISTLSLHLSGGGEGGILFKFLSDHSFTLLEENSFSHLPFSVFDNSYQVCSISMPSLVLFCHYFFSPKTDFWSVKISSYMSWSLLLYSTFHKILTCRRSHWGSFPGSIYLLDDTGEIQHPSSSVIWYHLPDRQMGTKTPKYH